MPWRAASLKNGLLTADNYHDETPLSSIQRPPAILNRKSILHMLSKNRHIGLAACVLLAAAAALLVCGLDQLRRTKYKLSQCPLYLYCQIMTRVVWRTQVSGLLPIADDQGAIIVSNHRGSLDPSCIALTCRRPVHWMVAKEYCDSLALGWFFHNLGSIPVNRGGIDTASTRMAIRLAQAGELVGMFPEGRINETDRFLLPAGRARPWWRCGAKVPVVPCWWRGCRTTGRSTVPC